VTPLRVLPFIYGVTCTNPCNVSVPTPSFLVHHELCPPYTEFIVVLRATLGTTGPEVVFLDRELLYLLVVHRVWSYSAQWGTNVLSS